MIFKLNIPFLTNLMHSRTKTITIKINISKISKNITKDVINGYVHVEKIS